jgi:hypothetical protein
MLGCEDHLETCLNAARRALRFAERIRRDSSVADDSGSMASSRNAFQSGNRNSGCFGARGRGHSTRRGSAWPSDSSACRCLARHHGRRRPQNGALGSRRLTTATACSGESFTSTRCGSLGNLMPGAGANISRRVRPTNTRTMNCSFGFDGYAAVGATEEKDFSKFKVSTVQQPGLTMFAADFRGGMAEEELVNAVQSAIYNVVRRVPASWTRASSVSFHLASSRR